MWRRASEQLQELNIGATAVGTGLNAGDDYRRLVVDNLARYTGLAAQAGANLFRVTQSMGDVLAYSGAMRRLAVEVGKIASDLRLLSMGPRAGLSEITLPAVQPGSSIMPGKGESVGARDGQSGVLSGDGLRHDGRDGVRGRPARAERDDAGHRLERAARVDDSARSDEGPADQMRRRHHGERGRARELLDRSTAMATALSPYIGYAATADIAKESVKTGRSIRDLVLERGLLDAARLDRILSPDAMTRGGIVGEKGKGRLEGRWVGGVRGKSGRHEGERGLVPFVVARISRPACRSQPARPAPGARPARPPAPKPKVCSRRRSSA